MGNSFIGVTYFLKVLAGAYGSRTYRSHLPHPPNFTSTTTSLPHPLLSALHNLKNNSRLISLELFPKKIVSFPCLFSRKTIPGGSVWESNPPKACLIPPNGFEVREAHRDSFAPSPSKSSIYHWSKECKKVGLRESKTPFDSLFIEQF